MFIRLPLSTKSHSSTLVFLRNCDNASKCVNVFWADIAHIGSHLHLLRSFWHWNIHHAGSRPTGRLLVCQCFIIGRGELPIDNKQCSMQHNSQTQCKIQATPTKSFSICSKQKNRNIIGIVIFFPTVFTTLPAHSLSPPSLHLLLNFFSLYLSASSILVCLWLNCKLSLQYQLLCLAQKQRAEGWNQRFVKHSSLALCIGFFFVPASHIY